MSSEVHNLDETILRKKENYFEAKVINFPNEKKLVKSKTKETNVNASWKLYDNSNVNEDGDQLRAVIGICFMFTSLILIGLYSSLV